MNEKQAATVKALAQVSKYAEAVKALAEVIGAWVKEGREAKAAAAGNETAIDDYLTQVAEDLADALKPEEPAGHGPDIAKA